MRNSLQHTLWASVVTLAFVAGALLGSYYSAEISVWVQAAQSMLGFTVAPPVPSPQPVPLAAADDQSVLEMAALKQPLPLIYSETLDEPRIQEYLKEGAVVLPLGTDFGEQGNVVVTAHSSGTTSFGPYRFAFAKLSELEEGEEFSVRTPTATYTYRVYGKEIVWPHEVDKLPNDDRSTVTLVTCWPLWTNFKRLLVHGELVSTASDSNSTQRFPAHHALR